MSWRACKSKVHHFDFAPTVQHQILRLDIAVNHVAFFVGKIQCISDLGSILRRQVLWHHAIDLQQATYRWTLHILHDEVEEASLLSRIIDLHNIWMIQSRDNLCFPD